MNMSHPNQNFNYNPANSSMAPSMMMGQQQQQQQQQHHMGHQHFISNQQQQHSRGTPHPIHQQQQQQQNTGIQLLNRLPPTMPMQHQIQQQQLHLQQQQHANLMNPQSVQHQGQVDPNFTVGHQQHRAMPAGEPCHPPSIISNNNIPNMLGGIKNLKNPVQEELHRRFAESAQGVNNSGSGNISGANRSASVGSTLNNGHSLFGPNLPEGFSGQISETTTGASSSVDVTNNSNLSQINSLINSPLTEEEEEILSEYDWYGS